MKLNIPPGVKVSMMGSIVTLIFPTEESAENFCEWLQWMDKQEEETEMVLTPGPRKPRVQWTDPRVEELRSIDRQLTREEVIVFLQAFAGACSNAIRSEAEWKAVIAVGKIAVAEFCGKDL